MNKVNTSSKSFIQLWFWLLMNCIGWLFVGSMGCLAMSVVIIAMHGQEVGFRVMQNLIQQDYQYILQTAPLNSHCLVDQCINKINNWPRLPNFMLPQQMSEMHLNFHAVWRMILPYLGAILLGLNLLVLRLYLILRWCPLFLLLGLVGFVDGLTQRCIRRASAGRESALIYHQAKSLILLSLILGIFMDLILPIKAEQSEWILVIAAILFAMAFQVTARSFKKYM